ncbi:1113_t:CDS:1 [Dentiscutata erythropus]|uniref:1113_t:CDS:1 n=1 Tax=Dentiscutata erythropus TaxID=1348616 RepID=A0A9N8V4K6_9GLOM|nr:1113_t:CDS:1 [Dentiscutata erythropus]
MNRNFIFILLIALSVTNTIPLEKRSTNFTDVCYYGVDPREIISASVSPDPVISGQNVTFNVSRTLSNAITNKGLIYIDFCDDDSSSIIYENNSTAPQTAAGSSFKANLTFEAPANLPSSYIIQVLVMSPSDLIGCIIASVS